MNARSCTRSKPMNLRRAAGPIPQALAYLYATRNSRTAAHPIRLSPRLRWRLRARAPGLFGLPMRARVADLLADAMLVMDEAMNMCEDERAAPLEAARLAARIHSISDQLNLLMKTISD
jgi:hypothetical protein